MFRPLLAQPQQGLYPSYARRELRVQHGARVARSRQRRLAAEPPCDRVASFQAFAISPAAVAGDLDRRERREFLAFVQRGRRARLELMALPAQPLQLLERLRELEA